MSTLSVSNITSPTNTTPLVLSSANSEAAFVRIEAANNDIVFNGFTKFLGGFSTNSINVAYDTTNSVYNFANSAYASINSNWTVTNTVFASINSNWTITNTAYGVTNTVYEVTNTAYTQANAAYTQANTAYIAANTKVTTGKSIAMAIVFS